MRQNRADFAMAAGRPENFFVEKCGNPLDFRRKYKYNYFHHEKKEGDGRLQAGGEQAQEAAHGRNGDRGDPVGGPLGLGGALPADPEGQRAHPDGLRPAGHEGGGGGLDAALEVREDPLKVLKRLIKVNPSPFVHGAGEGWGQKFFSFRGRPPAEQPDADEALRALRDFIRPFREVLNPLLVGLLPEEDEARCVYSTITLFWTVVLGFIEHLHSRNQMDMVRNSRAYSQTVFECSGQGYSPDDPRLHTACSQTWHDRFARADSVRLENALLGLVRHLVRGKWFDSARLCGRLAIAVDGTLREDIRSSSLPEREKKRYALEARAVTPWGWNIPVLFEEVAPYEGDKEKQDCELSAFRRLEKRLKRAFPNLAVCILGDALYACRPVVDICKSNHWDYVLVFKEGSSPKVYRQAHDAMAGRDNTYAMLRKAEDGTEQCVGRGEWIDATEVQYDSDEPLEGWVVTCEQWYPFDECYRGEFLTSLPVNDGARAELVASWGRRRWNVENGFHAEKHGGFGLEHTFCNDRTASHNVYVIMEIAYALWQVFDTGYLKRLGRRSRKVTQEGWAKLIFTAVLIIGFHAIGGFAADLPVRRMYRERIL